MSPRIPCPPQQEPCQCCAYPRSEEHTSELQSHSDLVCRLLLEKKKITHKSALFVLRRIRHGLGTNSDAPKLTGTVEADETYVGGRPRRYFGYTHTHTQTHKTGR